VKGGTTMKFKRVRFLGHRLFEHGSESGQALVETSVSVLFLVFLIMGTTEFARLAYAAIEVTNAAKAAVQYAAQNSATSGDSAGVQTAASNDAPNLTVTATLQPLSIVCSSGVAFSISTGCPSGTSAISTVTVTTTTTYNPLIHIAGFRGSFTLTGQASEVVQD
jgi:Flp pilus assembly protein TadG